jgi:hypothetical protein
MIDSADAYFASLCFTPAFTPAEMLQLGVFDCHYYGPELPAEFPVAWRPLARVNGCAAPEHNAFGVHSGLSRADWERAGWMRPEDPLGWFQWYCRWTLGRRIDDDVRQIARWCAYVRHTSRLLRNAATTPDSNPVGRQSLLHWAYDPFPDFEAKRGESVFEKTLRLLRRSR